MPRRVALALGSGGARGYAHIGVIRELHSRGYEVVGLAGSSMGALVGDTTIESLPIPYTAVTTDLIAGKSVWLQRGRIDEAIRASIAIPGVIAPHELDGRLLADGGILDPLPIAPAAVNADLTVAVSVSGAETDAADNQGAGVSSTRERLSRLRRSTSALFDRLSTGTAFDISDLESEESAPALADDELGDADRGAQLPKLRSFAVMMRTIDIAQAALARHQMAAYPPDVLIEVPRTACRSLDFHRAAELIDVGHELAGRALDRLEPESPAAPD